MTDSVYRKYSNKRVNAAKEGIPFNLSYDEFVHLMAESHISVDDLHIKGYHLARYGDTGSYEIGNCRFIPYLDNYSEKVITEKSRNASRSNIRKYRDSLSPEQLSDLAKKGVITRKLNNTEIIPDNSISAEELNRRLDILSKYDKMKRGWVTECSKEIGISHTQLRRFMKQQGIV